MAKSFLLLNNFLLILEDLSFLYFLLVLILYHFIKYILNGFLNLIIFLNKNFILAELIFFFADLCLATVLSSSSGALSSIFSNSLSSSSSSISTTSSSSSTSSYSSSSSSSYSFCFLFFSEDNFFHL